MPTITRPKKTQPNQPPKAVHTLCQHHFEGNYPLCLLEDVLFPTEIILSNLGPNFLGANLYLLELDKDIIHELKQLGFSCVEDRLILAKLLLPLEESLYLLLFNNNSFLLSPSLSLKLVPSPPLAHVVTLPLEQPTLLPHLVSKAVPLWLNVFLLLRQINELSHFSSLHVQSWNPFHL